jgi:hypothetical protein
LWSISFGVKRAKLTTNGALALAAQLALAALLALAAQLALAACG